VGELFSQIFLTIRAPSSPSLWLIKIQLHRAPVPHACNPSYSEAEIRRIAVPSRLGQIVCENLSQKTSSQKRAGGMVQGVDPEFKPQNNNNKKAQTLWVLKMP
jgi:hypothetical protein